MRWSDAAAITLLHGQPHLPEAWWRSLPVPRVLSAIGPESLGELLTEIALEHWPAAAVGDVLPALHVLDPDEADEPHVAIALDRAGSWPGLLALSSRELMDQPFVKARPVLNTLFGSVFVRLAPGAPIGERRVEAPPAADVAPVVDAAPAVGAVPEDVHADEAHIVVPEPVVETPAAEQEPFETPEPAPVAEREPVEEPELLEERAPEHAPIEEHEPLVAAEPVEEPEPVAGPEPVVKHEEQGWDAFQSHSPVHQEDHEPAPVEPQGDFHTDPDAEEAEHEEESRSEAPEPPIEAAEAPESPVDAAGEPEPPIAANVAAYPEPPVEAAEAHESLLDAAREPEPLVEAEPAEEPVAALAVADQHDLHALIESSFAGLDDKSWAVAQNRVFTDTPSAVEQLAKLFAVSKEEIVSVEAALRQRLQRWLAAEETAPYRAHLDELRARLGENPPKELLAGAAGWHGKEIRALDVPAWQFVQATMAALVRVPDLAPPPPDSPFHPVPQVQESPFQPAPLFQEPPFQPAPPAQEPPFQPAQEPPFQAAIPPDAPFQAPSQEAPFPSLPPQPPFQAPEPPRVQQDGPADGNGKPYQGFKDVSLTKRCFRQPDGRWWLRIDVTAEQLATGECALPSGFAAYLGLTPGASWTVRSAAGELMMSWHGRPSISQMGRLLADVGAREGGHLFITLSKEGVLRAKHLPVSTPGASKISKALRLADYTGLSSAIEHAARIIAIRIGMSGNVSLEDLKTRLRERGDRDLFELLD
ncbi:hypothetical protein [Nonomuraea africana]|uniref:hypothetical protein n=1 Tax=Nonomuraea africana TaxID=46171 RepID=UPI0033D38F8E